MGLLDRFFETTAAGLVLNRAENSCLTQLATKGYLSPENLDRLRSEGLLQSVARRDGTGVEADVEERIAPLVAAYRREKMDFVIVEDDVLRAKLISVGVRCVTTPDIVFHMVKKGALTVEEGIGALEGLRLLGWHDPETLERIQAAVREEAGSVE
ncbi:hypothetical protein [Mycobacterium sp.]|uniref:hypothetical protein n=1 Tax=Mycobacterium sp. TaxID=1785 RepID=UPI002C8DEECA|nr:hypothetical protein [Mycobacterium sp.]HTY33957.1 hypothetical protein [Mycobacterium sp.]